VHATVVILTKLPGYLPIKTRLHGLLGKRGAESFYLESLARTIRIAHAFCDQPLLATSPERVDPQTVLKGLPRCRMSPVADDNGAVCLEHALALAPAGLPVVALGGDAPDLPPGRIRAALDALRKIDVAFVPTPDGGFSCMALREPVAGLAEGFSYGEADALASLEQWLRARGLRVARLEPWPDVDTPEDYEAFRKRDASA
jgi:glycosyltransferase A (GT-A) superfamily protein (DUF2064 family)